MFNVLSMYFPPCHGHLQENLVTVNRDKGDMCQDMYPGRLNMLCKHKPAYFQSLLDFLSALKSTDGEPRALASFLALGWTSYDPVNQHYLGITIWICFLGSRSEDMHTIFFSQPDCSQTWSLTIAGLQSSCVASNKVKICHGCSVSNLCIVEREREDLWGTGWGYCESDLNSVPMNTLKCLNVAIATMKKTVILCLHKSLSVLLWKYGAQTLGIFWVLLYTIIYH